MKNLRLIAAGETDIGTNKTINQDSFVYKVVKYNDKHMGIFAVADGVGGESKGEEASKLAITTLNTYWEKELKSSNLVGDELLERLAVIFKEINKSLLEYPNESIKRVATTFSVLIIKDEKYYLIHTGDSRIYKFSDSLLSGTKVKQLTKDYTCKRFIEFGNEKFEKAYLTDCLGAKENFQYQIDSGNIKNKDFYIVCSDGIYKTISDESIMEMVNKYRDDPSKCCKNLINKAKENKETDNISIVSIKIEK